MRDRPRRRSNQYNKTTDQWCDPLHWHPSGIPRTALGRRHLRSAAVHQLTVPPVRRSTFSSRAFASAGPTVWNSLPQYSCDPAVSTWPENVFCLAVSLAFCIVSALEVLLT